MAKFMIECPNCGKYAEASNGLFKTGLFSTKTINCACGHVIDIRADKMTSRTCPHCGNNVIIDQSKGEDALCPVCKAKVNTLESVSHTVEITCPRCACVLIADKDKHMNCPLCDAPIDVNARAAAQKVRKEGVASDIEYVGDNSTFVWKHPITDFNLGSQLTVRESQEALFFRDGQALDLFGSGRHTLSTQNLPLLTSLYQIPTNADTIFHSEVYFINKTVQMAVKWGTPDKVRFIDPLTSTPLEIGASGEMNIQVSDSRKLLIKLVGTMKGVSWEEGSGLTKSLQSSFRPLIANAVKTNLSAVIKAENIDLLEIDTHLDLISESLRKKITAGFEEYGLTIPQFYVTSIVLPGENGDNSKAAKDFERIRQLHLVELQKREYQARAEAEKTRIQSEADIKTQAAVSAAQYRVAEEQSQAAIEAEHRRAELERQTTETEIAKMEAQRRIIAAQATREEGLVDAEVMAAKGYNYRDVLQSEVQKAYAEGIGDMGPVVSGGGGSNIVGDMLGLGVGLAAANAISPQIGNMMQGMGAINAPQAPAADTWDCSCGQKGIVGNFCNNCGAKKPSAQDNDRWDCACGQKGITGKFCSNCGAPKPEAWDCACGQKGITGKFCNNCGAPKPEAWDCSCGQKGITGNFCNNCGAPKPVTWDCSCGQKGITGGFCGSCGAKKP